VQSGYEASAVLGGNHKFGDTWKMLQWQVSGRMGGRKGGNAKSNGGSKLNGNGNGHKTNQPSATVHMGNTQGREKEEAFRIL
ncbi:MAG: hypothetical protein ACRD4A_12315, partial [Candidatus Acidiferrales bacterium]